MFSETDFHWMREALRAARVSGERGEAPVGAVIARGMQEIALCGNTRESARDPTGHAEINALREAAGKLGGWRLDGCTLYVTLEPCAMCASAAAQARVARIVFGAYDARAGCCGSVYRISEDPALGFYVPCEGGLLRAECETLLRAIPFRTR